MTEKFIKINSYTLEQRNTDTFDIQDADYMRGSRTLTRQFNFKSQQLMTIFSEKMWEGGNDVTPGSTTISNQMKIENFADIQSQDEIAEMHQKLVDLKGNPPPLGIKRMDKQLPSLPTGSL